MSGNQIERLIDNRVRQTGRNEKKESDKERKKRKKLSGSECVTMMSPNWLLADCFRSVREWSL